MDENDTITVDTIDDILSSTITINSKSTIPYTYSSMGTSYGNITMGTTSGLNGTWGTTGLQKGLYVNSDAEFEGDVKIKGVSLLDTLEKIEKRLAILRPDPEKLKHFESLKKAYEHYKTLEALCELPTEDTLK